VAFRLALVALLSLFAVACGNGGPDAYTVEEIRAAFETQGYELVEPPPDPSGFALNPWEETGHVVLAPEDGAGFKVYIGEASAEEATAEADFEAHRANVLVLSEGALPEEHQERVRTVLEALPDRGSDAVVTAR
jgi:hypothetical protein